MTLSETMRVMLPSFQILSLTVRIPDVIFFHAVSHIFRHPYEGLFISLILGKRLPGYLFSLLLVSTVMKQKQSSVLCNHEKHPYS